METASLTPGQIAARKAAETRRLRAAARQQIEAVKVGTSAPSPVGDARYVHFNCGDESPAGCGWRELLVTSLGPKWATVVYVPLLARWRVDRYTFDKFAKALNVTPETIRARVEAAVDTYQRTMPDESADRFAVARDALAAL